VGGEKHQKRDPGLQGTDPSARHWEKPKSEKGHDETYTKPRSQTEPNPTTSLTPRSAKKLRTKRGEPASHTGEKMDPLKKVFQPKRFGGLGDRSTKTRNTIGCNLGRRGKSMDLERSEMCLQAVGNEKILCGAVKRKQEGEMSSETVKKRG